MKGVCVIISCFATSARLDTIRTRWLNNFPIPHVIVRGNPKQAEECVRTGDIYTLKCDDSYDGLPHKVLKAIQYVKKTFNPDYILKIDDDVIVNTEKLFDLLKTTDGEDYVGYATYSYVFEKDVGIASAYCGGPLYYLSRRAMDVLIEHMDPSDCHIEDLLVGKTLLENDICLRCEFIYTINPKNKDAPAFHDTERTQFLPNVKSPLPPLLVSPPSRPTIAQTAETQHISEEINRQQVKIQTYRKSTGLRFI